MTGGPNTAVVINGSAIFSSECQVEYSMRAIGQPPAPSEGGVAADRAEASGVEKAAKGGDEGGEEEKDGFNAGDVEAREAGDLGVGADDDHLPPEGGAVERHAEEDQEDEDAFLDCLLQVGHLQWAAYPCSSICCAWQRRAGSSGLLADVLPGAHASC
jgi:hypothetical protein